jgi:hypothetical protein
MGEKWPVKFSLTMRIPCYCRVLLHAAKLRHGTDGFTFPPKEGMLRNFALEKPTASAGFYCKPQTKDKPPFLWIF